MLADDENSTSGDSTDVFSSKFDPLKALNADKTPLPDDEAPTFDNISKFESFCLKGLHAKIDDDEQTGERTTSTSRPFVGQDSTKSIVVGKQKSGSDKNVINRMGKCLGPLAALYQYMENKIKVKVYTRRINGIRGYIEAYIVAFDTHWNLALEDCFEVWSRKIAKKRKSPALGDTNKIVTIETNPSYTAVVKKKNKQMETLERHVSQLLLRGEQIVSIVKLDC